MLRYATIALAVLTACSPAFAATGRVTTSFDAGWRFLKADAKGAEQPGFKDASWRALSVPHDWSIEGPYDQANPTGRGGGYLPAGVGWYRKQFTLPQDEAGRRVRVEFDGVMANSEVWVNGHLLGKRPYGYASFTYDLTPYLKFGKGQLNVIAVRADNSVQPASRYYTGAGIYRHVRLVSTAPVHFGEEGVYVTTPQAGAANASVRIAADIRNDSRAAGDYSVVTTVYDPEGKAVSTIESQQHVEPGKSATATQTGDVASPARWSIDQPKLYKAVTVIRNGDTVLDEQVNNFGIREAKFEADTGFWLNGVNLKIKGACIHHDAGALGAAVPLAIWEYRFQRLKEAGVNALRTSHNPVAPEVLDLADRMGFLVMDETFDTWTAAKQHGEQGYNRFWSDWWATDTRSMVIRDRNHPSIILYSVGNEIHDDLDSPEGFKKYKQQQDLIHQLDPGRPVTMALFRPANSKVYLNGFADMMDIVGQNYREDELVAAHKAHPQWKVIGTENAHLLPAWLAMRDNPFMAGQFIWIGFDYLGEADWPAISFDKGLFDRIGNWHPRGMQRQSWWSEKPMVHVLRHADNGGAGALVADWTPNDIDGYDDARLEVYSNADEVELFLNGQSLGTKAKPADDSPRQWKTTFARGVLRAVARNHGQVVATEELRTAGAPAKIELSSTKPALAPTFDDAAYVTARVVDADGVTVPQAITPITFTVGGKGVLAAVDNGSFTSHEPYLTNRCVAANGLCAAVVKAAAAGGKITIQASGTGLAAGSLTLDTIAK
ncbi:hypothetical protein GCM10027321_03860 [Massilia terrae]|uniref:DUF4982 domain-containing protein n=1 Tax=Massilia terrae TaxID=1811224 RepID=A0ABT2CTY7_9BURK|nr:sugar-binding domain-containing protein [Massilia terrae]MCS0657250.1 DUF4982 domain-containing protein [Massilia terrae]